ncbi:MAG: zf-HC2 domain-containing protein [Bacillota bacterium]
MNCDHERLQAYLDGALTDSELCELKGHLAECRACRRELSRLKLLWSELSQPEEIPLPPELPYLRQQAVTVVRRTREEQAEKYLGFWEIQRLAWSPLGLSAAYLPGSRQVVNLVRATGKAAPGLLQSSIKAAARLPHLGQRGKGRDRR